MYALAEINWPRRQQDASSGGDVDHVRDADARTAARNTAVSCVASSTPAATRTTAPASSTSITGAARECCRRIGAVTIGTNPHATVSVLFVGAVVTACRIARRQPNTCCEQTCQRRATSDTRPPAVMLTICAFSSADQRRRRPGPVSSSTRQIHPSRHGLTSNIRIARSLLPQANQALPGRPSKKGGASL